MRVVKRSESDAGASELLEQERLLTILRETVSPTLYPQVLGSFALGFDSEFLTGDTLASYIDTQPTRAGEYAIQLAVETLFVNANRYQTSQHLYSETAGSFVPEVVEARWNRFRAAIATCRLPLMASNRFDVALLDRVVTTASAQMRSRAGSMQARLTTAVHGDFVPTNIIRGADGETRFIDVRARWSHGLPVWDPILDLASLSVFTEHLWPSITKAGFSAPMVRQLPEGSVVEQANQTSSFQAWVDKDTNWKQRFAVYRAARALGNIGNHLTTTRENGFECAIAVLGPLRFLGEELAVV